MAMRGGWGGGRGRRTRFHDTRNHACETSYALFRILRERNVTPDYVATTEYMYCNDGYGPNKQFCINEWRIYIQQLLRSRECYYSQTRYRNWGSQMGYSETRAYYLDHGKKQHNKTDGPMADRRVLVEGRGGRHPCKKEDQPCPPRESEKQKTPSLVTSSPVPGKRVSLGFWGTAREKGKKTRPPPHVKNETGARERENGVRGKREREKEGNKGSLEIFWGEESDQPAIGAKCDGWSAYFAFIRRSLPALGPTRYRPTALSKFFLFSPLAFQLVTEPLSSAASEYHYVLASLFTKVARLLKSGEQCAEVRSELRD